MKMYSASRTLNISIGSVNLQQAIEVYCTVTYSRCVFTGCSSMYFPKICISNLSDLSIVYMDATVF
jgi:hypothetical protein